MRLIERAYLYGSSLSVCQSVCVVCVWKFLGNFDPAFASAEHHHPLLVYLALSTINHSFIEVKVACPGAGPASDLFMHDWSRR